MTSGVRDFERYRVDPSVPLMSDFFVPDDDVPPPGVTVQAAALGWRRAEVALETLASRDDGERAVGWRAWTAGGVQRDRHGGRRRPRLRPDRAIRVATGVVAHNVCSKIFVSGLDPQTVFAETAERDGIRRLRRVLRFQFDRGAKFVDASLAGGFSQPRGRLS